MINESDGPQHSQEDQNVYGSPNDPMLGQFEGVIGEAIEKAVSQYQALLQHSLETEVKRIVSDFEVATSDVEQVVGKQTRARLCELIEDEVRAVFDDTLGEAEGTLADPIWRKARDLHIPYLAPKKSEEEAHKSRTPAQAHPTDHVSVPRPEASESERVETEGPKPIAPPSPNWVFPSDQQMPIRVQEGPDQTHSSTDAFADPHQPPINDDESYTDALSAVIDDNSDLETVVHDNNDIVHIAHDPDQGQESEGDVEPGPFGEIDDEELMEAELLDLDDFDEPEWDLPDSPPGTSDNGNAPDHFTSGDMETAEAVVVEIDEKSVPVSRQEEESTPEEGTANGVSDDEQAEPDAAVADEAVLRSETAAHDEEDSGAVHAPSFDAEDAVDSPADDLETSDHAAGAGEEESAPENEQAADESPVETTTQVDAIEDDDAGDHTEVVASVVDEPPLKADEPPEPENEQTAVFEGTVRLNVEAPGCVREIVQFVRELRQKPQLRLLRLVGNNREGVDIWLGLREPLNLGTILPEMQGVTIISKPLEHVGGADERLLSVRLIRQEVPQNSGAHPPADSMPVENSKVVA